MLADEAYAVLGTLNRRDRRKLEAAFDALRSHPFAEPSFIGFDSNGEEHFHLFLDAYAIVYHVDHAMRLVYIQDIVPNP